MRLPLFGLTYRFTTVLSSAGQALLIIGIFGQRTKLLERFAVLGWIDKRVFHMNMMLM